MKIYYYSEEIGTIRHHRVGLLSYLAHWLEKVALCVPLLTTGYAFMDEIFPRGLPVHINDAMIIVLAYVLYNAMIFCNGWMIALFWKGDSHWKFIYGGCIIHTFGATAIGTYLVLQRYFPGHLMITGTVAYLVAHFVYTRFHFLKDEVPLTCVWVYKWGLRTGS